jgi:2'-5' RNA ligase
MRVFIAIEIDEHIRKSLADLQKQLRDQADIRKGDVKWVNPESVHLTLKFLGEIKDSAVVEVCNIVENTAAQHSSFELAIESVGCFGTKAARVLWVGTGQGNERLFLLQNELEKNMAQAGWPEEARGFSGHLTLCRIKNAKAGVRLAGLCQDYNDFKLGTILVDSVSVYQSQLTPAGPIYTVLGNYKLS